MHCSLDENVPLCEVLSEFSSTSVEQRLFSKIDEEIGSSWSKIAHKTGTDRSVIAEIRDKFPHPEDASRAASEFLNRWFESRDKTVMVCELYDVLCDAGLSALAQRKLRYVMMPDDASGFVENNPFGSGPISSDVIDVVADEGRDKWREIGSALGLTYQELAEYDQGTLKGRLYSIVTDWIRRDGNCTLRELLEVCSKVGIKGGVIRKLKALSREIN